jgi:hypothetical protein
MTVADLIEEDVAANVQGVQHDLCIFSSYQFSAGQVCGREIGFKNASGRLKSGKVSLALKNSVS